MLGVTILALGVAGSATDAGNAQSSSGNGANTTIQQSVGSRPIEPGGAASSLPVSIPTAASISTADSISTGDSVSPRNSVPSAFDRRSAWNSRAAVRPVLTGTASNPTATPRDLGQQATLLDAEPSAQSLAVALREKSVAAVAHATKRRDQELRKVRQATTEKRAEQHKADRKKAAAEEQEQEQTAKIKGAPAEPSDDAEPSDAADSTDDADSSSGSASLPITSDYRIAARFGDTGSWARYHTGIDFAAPMGSPIHAVAAGTVTHAGSGSADWAGHYVTIRHSDGKTSLYAHMSTVSVHKGEQVSGGEKVGAIGMTGRTFGPHVHFEIYPAGAKVGSPYQAVNPAPWLHARGLHF